jgi:protein involved in polysaccharide export with SLBB domain
LFLRGDLVQNLAMAPEDYVYFSPADMPLVYVLGPGIAAPGPMPYSPNMTVLKALASRGGFADKAYQSRVLVVRGSLSHPQTFVVNTPDILKAKTVDFRLEPRDIVYVSKRPWAKAENCRDCNKSFLRAVIVTWTGLNVGPWISEPVL